MSNFIRQFNDEMASLIEGVRPALVQVTNGRRGAGAGIIWSPDGLIVTNAHVIRRHSPQVVLADGRSFPARLLGYDRHNDVAALAVEAAGLPALPIGSSRELQPGQLVTAMGHPWGVTGAITTGVVVGVGQGMPGIPGGERDLIAVSLHLRPGYSGGPLFDTQGRVVGINTMMAGPDVGLAVPAHVVEAFLKALAEQQGLETPEPRWTRDPLAIDV